MLFYPINILLLCNSIFLAVFSYGRLKSYLDNPTNTITYRYFHSSLFVSASMFVYGISFFITSDQALLSLLIALAVVLNAIGFNSFLLISLHGKWGRKSQVIIKYVLYFFVVFIISLIIVSPPLPFLDIYNIPHWGLSPLLGIVSAVHMDIVFLANTILLFKNFYRLKKLSFLNSFALIVTFIFAGVSGTYQYVGNDPLLLFISSVFLFLGISMIFVAVVHKKMPASFQAS